MHKIYVDLATSFSQDPRRLDPRRVAVSVAVSQPPVNIAVKSEEQEEDVPSPTSVAAVEPCSSPGSILIIGDIKEENSLASAIPEEINSPPSIHEAKTSLETISTSDDSLLDAVIPDVDSSQQTQSCLAISLENVVKPSTPPSPPDTEGHTLLLEPMDIEESGIDLSPGVGEANTTGLTDIIEPEDSEMALRASVQVTPSVHIPDAQQSELWKMIMLRILENYKVAGSATSSHLCFSLVARLVSQASTSLRLYVARI